MIIVADEAQRKGIGGALMDALLADAAGRTVILNSTVEGFPLYSRLGFVPHGHVHQHQAILPRAFAGEPTGTVRELRESDRATVYDLDLEASGMDRRRLLDLVFEIGEMKVVERGGRISGYGCVRPWGRGVVIGPVVAANSADARALIAELAASQVGRFVRIDVPVTTGLSPWLEEIGLPQVEPRLRWRGQAPGACCRCNAVCLVESISRLTHWLRIHEDRADETQILLARYRTTVFVGGPKDRRTAMSMWRSSAPGSPGFRRRSRLQRRARR